MRDQMQSPSAIPALLLAAALLTGDGCQRGRAEPPPSGPEQMVLGTENIAIAGQGTVTTGPVISGSLQPALEATVRAQVSGSVLSTSADVGQTVTRGQLLGRIDATALQDAAQSARAAVASARVQYDLAQRNQQRSQTLLGAGAIAPRDYEAAQQGVSSARAALQAVQAQLATAEKNLANTRITAPFAGIVSQRSVSAGDVVQPGTALFTVVDPSSMRLEAAVPSDQLAQVRVGTRVQFSVTGYPGREFTGTVTRVSPAVDPATRQVQILVTVPNPGRQLVAGLFADGRVASRTERGIVVPQSAVDTRYQRPTVARIRNGKAERVDVELGASDDATETVAVVSGVSVGDTLLLGAARGISPGTPVRVQPPPSDVSASRGAPAAGGAATGATGAAPGPRR